MTVYCTTTYTADPLETLAWKVMALFAAPDTGERGALEEEFMRIVTEHSSLITRLCFHYATDREPLDDLRQDCLINIWKGLPSFRRDSNLTTWLYRVVLNTCITSYRSAQRRPKLETLDASLQVADEPSVADEEVRMLQGLLARLPLVDRGLMMMWLDERPYEEIAEVSGLSRSNVAVRLHRIRAKMKDLWQAAEL